MTPDRDLVRGCRRRDAASQEALYRRYWPFALSIALRYTPTRDDALELCHDAFLKAFAGMGGVDPERPFKPWFRRVLVRAAVDRHRSTRRYHATVRPEAAPPDVAVAADQVAALEADEILALLGRLSDDQRAVFNLHEVEGYSHDEIAALLGVAPGTSRSHLTRAKRRLQALYLHQTGTPS